MWKRLVLAELHAGVQISNKEVAVKPKFAIHNVKSEVSFSLYKPLYKNIDKLRVHQSPRIWKAVRGFVVLLFSTVSDFPTSLRDFPLPLATLLIIVIIVLLIAPLTMSAMDYFSREIFDSWSLMPGGSVVPSVGSFRRRDNFLARRELFNCEPLWAKISHLILRGIQPVWLILLCIKICPIVVKISPKHSRSNDKRKCVGKFWYLKYCSRCVHLRDTPRIFFSYSNFNADI